MISVERCFQTQHGLITTEQAIAAGLTRHQIAHRADSGDWIRVRRGVMRTSHVAFAWEARLYAAVLGRRAVASHRAAAALANLEIGARPRPEITVPHRARSVGDAVAHHTSQWELRDETRRRGIPCTGIERTIVDLAAVVSIEAVELAAESAIRQELTSWTKIESCLAAHAAAGRAGVGRLRRLLDFRRHAATVPRSGFSRLVAQLLTREGLPEPILEYQVRAPDGTHILFLDLAWPDRMMAWELDGLETHFGRTDLERDKDVRNRCKAEGWRIQEVTWRKFRDEPEQLVALCRRFLAS